MWTYMLGHGGRVLRTACRVSSFLLLYEFQGLDSGSWAYLSHLTALWAITDSDSYGRKSWLLLCDLMILFPTQTSILIMGIKNILKSFFGQRMTYGKCSVVYGHITHDSYCYLLIAFHCDLRLIFSPDFISCACSMILSFPFPVPDAPVHASSHFLDTSMCPQDLKLLTYHRLSWVTHMSKPL